MSVPTREVAEDGFERQFGTNYLGPFALSVSAPAAASFAITAHHRRLERRGEHGAATHQLRRSPMGAVVRAMEGVLSIQAPDLLMVVELTRRMWARGITLLSTAVHPGYARTNLKTSGPGKPQGISRAIRSASQCVNRLMTRRPRAGSGTCPSS
jgi:NAD(P)-dependent dehydrogenase (short-subunit alcohol dehydrogenase family)